MFDPHTRRRQQVPDSELNQLAEAALIRNDCNARERLGNELLARGLALLASRKMGPHEASDYVQSAMAIIFNPRRCNYDCHRSIWPYFRRILKNLVRQQRRSFCRRPVAASNEELLNAIAEHTNNPRDKAAASEQAEALSLAIEQLPPLQKEVIHLRYFQEMSQMEAAETLGIGRWRLRALEIRAIERLGEILKPSGGSHESP